MNIICDNALLCGYARSQKIVTADMIKEVARDLGLGSKAQVAKPEISSSCHRSLRPNLRDPFAMRQTMFLATTWGA